MNRTLHFRNWLIVSWTCLMWVHTIQFRICLRRLFVGAASFLIAFTISRSRRWFTSLRLILLMNNWNGFERDVTCEKYVWQKRIGVDSCGLRSFFACVVASVRMLPKLHKFLPKFRTMPDWLHNFTMVYFCSCGLNWQFAWCIGLG